MALVMNTALRRRCCALALAAFSVAVQAEAPHTTQAKAADFATCAAFYFNAVNVKPLTEYETTYGAGERAFNEGIKLVGREPLNDLMARSSGEMMKLMNSDWKNFPTVAQRYSADCDALMASVPAP